MANMLQPHYRAAHEPNVRDVFELAINYLKGHTGRDEVARSLIQRDRRLRLEMESAHPLVYLADVLVEVFPKARFVVTVREPYFWLRSRLSWSASIDMPSWASYVTYFYERHHNGYAPQETILKEYGLFALDVYLRHYTDHYKRIFSHIPTSRRIVVHTRKIDERAPEIARFIGACPDKLRKAHGKRQDQKLNILGSIDDDFVQAQIDEHCSTVLRELF